MNKKTCLERTALPPTRRKPPREAQPVDASTLPAGCVQRARLAPQQLTGKDLAALQRTIGNSAVSRLMRSGQYPLQTKRASGSGGDRHEQEADRVARQVTRGLESATEDSDTTVRQRTDALVQASTLPRAAHARVSPEVESTIERRRGSGHSLAGALQAPLERVYGANFGGVKIHTDADADRLNRTLDSRAFTSGRDIFFRRAEYNPGTRAGRELLPHELTHVVQQKAGGGKAAAVQRKRTFPQGEADPSYIAFKPTSGHSYALSEQNYEASKAAGYRLKLKLEEWKQNKAKYRKKGTRNDLKAKEYRHMAGKVNDDKIKMASDRGWHQRPNTPPNPKQFMDKDYPGDYTNYYKRSGKFKAAWNMKDDDTGKLPGVDPATNSEIIWSQYKLALDKLGLPHKANKTGNLKEIKRASIINNETKDTIFWCTQAEDSYDPKTVTGTSGDQQIRDDFWALLGSPNGNSSAWLLMNHGESMGATDIESIAHTKNSLRIKFKLA